MSTEKEPLKIEIPVEVEVEEEGEPASKAESKSINIADELQNLGRQFAATLEAAWNSEERQRVEKELREGLNHFAEEVGKVATEVSTSPVAQKAKEEASELKGKVEASDWGRKSRVLFAQGLSRISDELSALSTRLTPTNETHAEENGEDELVEIKEKSPEDLR